MNSKVGKTEKMGRGMFAMRDIKKDEVIEECEIITFSPDDRILIDKTCFYNYYFGWCDGKGAIALGNGSLYNHSYSPNTRYDKNFDKGIISFIAIKDISADDEITVNYNGDPSNQEKIWFDAQ